MANKIFDRITKTMAILLVLCFVLSVTVASVNAAAYEDKYGQGYKDGYSKGSSDGKNDCNQYGSKDFIRKIPNPSNNDESYIKGFILGYKTGYNGERYTCLKNVHMLKK
jgi:branched-subunit amino acid permease